MRTLVAAGGGTFWAMPDNGYGAKTNSSDFFLRLYRIRPDFETADGGSGTVAVLSFIQLRDPDNRIPFALTRQDRLLTGVDFDLESVRVAKDGTLWFGEEFGPFEGMAISIDGKTLYPMLEGALRTDPDPRRRLLNEFDIRAGAYTGRAWNYHVDAGFPDAVIGDLTALDQHRFILIERDDFQGAEAQQKKIYLIDIRRTDASGFLEKQLVLDLLSIPDPDGISLPARPGEFGVGTTFAFPLQSVESLEVLGGERILIANDNNYPFSDGRWTARNRPDDTELIIVRVPALR